MDRFEERMSKVESAVAAIQQQVEFSSKNVDSLCEIVGDMREYVAASKEMIKSLERYQEENKRDHDRIFGRLDVLNGWRNKLLGALALVLIATPIACGVTLHFSG